MIHTHGNNFLEGRKYPSLQLTQPNRNLKSPIWDKKKSQTSIENPSTNYEIPIGNPNGHRRPKPTTTLHNQFVLTNPPPHQETQNHKPIFH